MITLRRAATADGTEPSAGTAARAGGRSASQARDVGDPRLLRGVATIVGSLLLVLSVLNLGMLWWAPQLGNAPWEFAVVGQTFDQLPLLVVGLLLLTYRAASGGGALRITLVAALAMMALGSAALSVIYGLAATVAWASLVQQPSAGAGLLLRSIIKTLVLGSAYVAAFGWWAVLLLRRPGGRHSQVG